MQRKAPLSVIARRCCLPAEPQRHDASPELPRLFEQRAEPAIVPFVDDSAVVRVLYRTGIQRCHRSEEHTSELQSLMRISYAVFCLKKKTQSHHATSNSINTPPITTKPINRTNNNSQQQSTNRKN